MYPPCVRLFYYHPDNNGKSPKVFLFTLFFCTLTGKCTKLLQSVILLRQKCHTEMSLPTIGCIKILLIIAQQ